MIETLFEIPVRTWSGKILSRILPGRYKYRRKLPQSWKEMTSSQLMKLVPYLFSDTRKRIRCELEIIQILLNIPDRVFYQLTADQLWDVKANIRWMFVDPLIIPPLEKFKFKGVTYYLAPDQLKSMTAIEYATAEAQWKLFTGKNPDIRALDKLVATVCRPPSNVDHLHPDYSGDPREPFNSAVMEQRAKKFTGLNANYKMAVLLYFSACMDQIRNQYGIIWDTKDPTSGSGDGEATRDWGLMGVIYDLAQDGAFGTFEQVCKSNIHTIFIYLAKRKLEDDERIRKSPKSVL